ncbi:hypothetical protein OZX67_04000 [Bifidobacterium sp. ESL0728]|uniref:hypothetical protein n=1 Tax=Bifidobacterium sp. ESL0728 TaxID=2983220 RepID=UPI0023F79FBE|nr:hypothetical protein [Bifidobacterium sp. ESL0728]WEV59710.1 hypothetical protein OZX67_04000 [Bifidobacterium sp. ESL0728]
MNVLDIIADIGSMVGGLGGIAGIVALVQTHAANQLAKQANATAKEANRIAGDSKTLAGKANDLASKANEISTDANTISNRALAVTADQTVYNWRVEFDGKSSTVYIVNDCGHEARDVTVFLRQEDETLTHRRFEEIPAFGEASLECKLLTKQIRKSQQSIDRNNASGFVFILGSGSTGATVHIVYTTELGSRRTDKIKKSFTDGKRH